MIIHLEMYTHICKQCTITYRYASNCLGKKKGSTGIYAGCWEWCMDTRTHTHTQTHLYTQPDAHIAVLDGMGTVRLVLYKTRRWDGTYGTQLTPDRHTGQCVCYSQFWVEDVQVAHIVSVVCWTEPGQNQQQQSLHDPLSSGSWVSVSFAFFLFL